MKTARRLDSLIEPGGALVLARTDHPDLPDNGWRSTLQAVLDAHGVGGARAIWRQPGWVPHEAVLLQSPFPALERIGIIERRLVSKAVLLGRAMSMSAASRARLGPEGLERLRGALAAALPEGEWLAEVVESSALIARRA